MHKQDKEKLDNLLSELNTLIKEYSDYKKYNDEKVTEIVNKYKEIDSLFKKYKLLSSN